jgi:hypothetical protein
MRPAWSIIYRDHMHGLTSRDMGRMAGPIQQAGHVHKSEEASPARSSRRHYRTPPDGSKHGEWQRHSVASYHREVNRNGGKERRHAFFRMALLRVCRRRPAPVLRRRLRFAGFV